MTIERPFLRVGHTERAKASEALDHAANTGRLSISESSDRKSRAAASKTRGELAALLSDVLPAAELAALVSDTPMRLPGGPGQSASDPLVIKAVGSSERLLGSWEAPPFLEVHPVLSNVALYFPVAPGVRVINLVHKGGAGSLLIVVPWGWGVDMSRHGKGLGSVHSEVAPRAQPGGVQIVLTGGGVLGNVRVRYRGRRDDRRDARELARQARALARAVPAPRELR